MCSKYIGRMESYQKEMNNENFSLCLIDEATNWTNGDIPHFILLLTEKTGKEKEIIVT